MYGINAKKHICKGNLSLRLSIKNVIIKYRGGTLNDVKVLQCSTAKLYSIQVMVSRGG